MSFDETAAEKFRAVAAADDRFERLVRRRVFLLYWLLCVANRLAESADVLNSGLGASLPGQLWTAMFVIASSAAVTEPAFRAARRVATRPPMRT